MTNIPQLTVGEYINLTIRGARIDALDCPGSDINATIALGSYRARLSLTAPGVHIERVAPAEWPPQTGDVWADRAGQEWHARVVQAPGDDLWAEMINIDDARFESPPRRDLADNVNEWFGPLQLVRRRGWTPTPAASVMDEDEPARPTRGRPAIIAGLRELADFLEAHPELEIPEFYSLNLGWAAPRLGDDPSIAHVKQVAAILDTEARRIPHGTDGKHAWRATRQFSGITFGVSYIEDTIEEPEPELVDEGHEGPVEGCECEDCDLVRDEATSAEPAPTAVEHQLVSGWGGAPGGCGVECACGLALDGFDSIAAATEELDRHIADAQPTPATAASDEELRDAHPVVTRQHSGFPVNGINSTRQRGNPGV